MYFFPLLSQPLASYIYILYTKQETKREKIYKYWRRERKEKEIQIARERERERGWKNVKSNLKQLFCQQIPRRGVPTIAGWEPSGVEGGRSERWVGMYKTTQGYTSQRWIALWLSVDCCALCIILVLEVLLNLQETVYLTMQSQKVLKLDQTKLCLTTHWNQELRTEKRIDGMGYHVL